MTGRLWNAVAGSPHWKLHFCIAGHTAEARYTERRKDHRYSRPPRWPGAQYTCTAYCDLSQEYHFVPPWPALTVFMTTQPWNLGTLKAEYPYRAHCATRLPSLKH